MHFYPFNIGDFALHTSHLTLEEEGVYRRLLDFYYDTESPIPLKTQPVIRRLRLGLYEPTVDVILHEFFIKRADGWHNLRADIEIADYHSRVETARTNGKKGGRPKKNSASKTQPVIVANPDLTQPKAKQELEPVTKKQEPVKKSRGFSPPSLSEVKEYCLSRNNFVNAETFIDFYGSKGWMVGKNKMKDWKACVRTWEKRDGESNGQHQQSSAKRGQTISKSERRDEAARKYLEENDDDGMAGFAGYEVSSR